MPVGVATTQNGVAVWNVQNLRAKQRRSEAGVNAGEGREQNMFLRFLRFLLLATIPCRHAGTPETFEVLVFVGLQYQLLPAPTHPRE